MENNRKYKWNYQLEKMRALENDREIERLNDGSIYSYGSDQYRIENNRETDKVKKRLKKDLGKLLGFIVFCIWIEIIFSFIQNKILNSIERLVPLPNPSSQFKPKQFGDLHKTNNAITPYYPKQTQIPNNLNSSQNPINIIRHHIQQQNKPKPQPQINQTVSSYYLKQKPKASGYIEMNGKVFEIDEFGKFQEKK